LDVIGEIKMSDALTIQITEAFNAEMSRGASPRTSQDIPSTYEAIGSEWLESVLGPTVPQARVLDFRLGPPDEGTNNRRRIHLEWNEAGREGGLPSSVFCKATQGLANRLMLGHSGGVLCEVSFQNLARPLREIEAPVCLHARFEPVSFASIVIFRDMAGEAEFCSEATATDQAFVEQQLDLLAALHARFFETAELHGELSILPTWYDRFHNLARFHLEESCAAGVEASETILPRALFDRREEIWGVTLESLEASRDMPLMLCHGDVHLKNWYRRVDGRLGLGDWGVAHRGHWSRDVCYTIATALDVGDRRRLEGPLLRHYLEALAARGGPRIGFDEALWCYRRSLPTAFAFWSMTLKPTPDFPDMQPPTAARVFIERLGAAMADHEALDAF